MANFKLGDRVRLKHGFTDHWTHWYQGIRTVKSYGSFGDLVVYRSDEQISGSHVQVSDNFVKVEDKRLIGGNIL